MPGEDEARCNLDAVPLFPLPGIVLLPRAVLPLHIFEFRYRQMTAHALQRDGRIAMALLRPGWEKDYHGRPAIEPAVCVGRIVSHEKLEDGKYNFLLQGELRAVVTHEYFDRPFRYARLTPIVEPQVMEIDLSAERQRLTELFHTPPLAATPLAGQMRKFLSGPVSTSDAADITAFHFLEQVDLKQELLAEADPRRRVRRVIGALEAILPLTAMLTRDARAILN